MRVSGHTRGRGALLGAALACLGGGAACAAEVALITAGSQEPWVLDAARGAPGVEAGADDPALDLADPQVAGLLNAHLLRLQRQADPDDPCPASPPELEAAAALAARELSFFKIEESEAALRDAEIALRCGQQVPDGPSLSSYLTTRALLSAFTGQPAEEAFKVALAADAYLSLDPGYPQEVVDALAQARDALRSAPDVSLTVDPATMGGLSVWIDGRRAEGVAWLKVGSHHVQLVDPRGRSAGAAVVDVPASASALPLPASLRPMAVDALVEELGTAAQRGRLMQPMRGAVDALREDLSAKRLVIVAPAPGDPEAARALIVTGADRTSALTLKRRRGAAGGGERRFSPASPAMVAVGLAGGIAYGAIYARLSTWPAQDYSGDVQAWTDDAAAVTRLRRIGFGSAAVGIGGVVGAATLEGIRLSRRLRPQAAREAESGGARSGASVSLGVSPTSSGVAMVGAVRW